MDSAALDAVVFIVIGAAFTTTARPRARAPRRDARRDPITFARAGALARALVVIVIGSIARTSVATRSEDIVDTLAREDGVVRARRARVRARGDGERARKPWDACERVSTRGDAPNARERGKRGGR